MTINRDALTPTGVELITGFRDMPEKTPGRHRWVAIVTHALGEEAAAALHDRNRSRTVFLDHESIADTSVGCLDCEQPWDAVHDKPCRAEAFPWRNR